MTAPLKVSVSKSEAREKLRRDLVEAMPTTRVCSEDGCENRAHYSKGHYLVGDRWVRVWVCGNHQVGNPNTVLPTPQNILDGQRIEQEYIAAQERKYRWRDGTPERSVSVKTLSSTGHGPQIMGDRVANFRWEPTPADLIARNKRLRKKVK